MTQTPETSSMHGEPATEPQVLYARIRWLNRLRWIYAALFAALAGGYFLTDLKTYVNVRMDDLSNLGPGESAYGYLYWAVFHAMLGLAIVVGGYAFLCSAIGWLTARFRAWHCMPAFLRVQLAIDMFGLIGVIHFTGGFYNPLVLLLLFHMGVSASFLKTGEAYGLAGATSMAYLAVALGEMILEQAGPVTLGSFTLHSERLGNLSAVIWTFSQSIQAWLYPVLVVGGLFGTTYFTNALLSRLRRINTRLVDANRRLEGLGLAKSRFLRVSAHQLRSPLAAIHTMLSAIQEAGGLNHQQYEIARKIQARSEDAMTLVDEMMLLSTLQESDAESKALRPTDLDAVVRAEAAAFASEARAKNLTLAVAAESGATVAAFEDSLETVLEHLVSNAIKYTPAGGRVGVEARRGDEGAVLLVRDSGIGIPKDQQERLFREFFRATNARQVAGGTGMGLAIVAAIVERLSGKISVESAEGQGTRVTVALPTAGGFTAEHAQGAEADEGNGKREKKRKEGGERQAFTRAEACDEGQDVGKACRSAL